MRLKIIGWVFTLFGCVGLTASEFASELSEKDFARLEAILKLSRKDSDLETAEKEFQLIVQKQTLLDIVPFYDPKSKEDIQITYSAFIPQAQVRPGFDGGWGLHVVKRLTRKLSDGKIKITDVNEAWPEDKVSHRLFYPDTIRIKTQIYDGKRKVEGSDKLYAYDLIRLAWKPGTAQPKLCRQTRFRYVGKVNQTKKMRYPVSAPYLCATCHSPASKVFETYAAKGETRNYESIVQDSFFKLPLKETRGFELYLKYLDEKKKPGGFLDDAKKALENPKKTFTVPGLLEALRGKIEECWLPEDELAKEEEAERQGVYETASGKYFRDALENLIPGKYSEWKPEPAVP